MKLEVAIFCASDILYLFGQGSFIFIREKSWNFEKLCLWQPCLMIFCLFNYQEEITHLISTVVDLQKRHKQVCNLSSVY